MFFIGRSSFEPGRIFLNGFSDEGAYTVLMFNFSVLKYSIEDSMLSSSFKIIFSLHHDHWAGSILSKEGYDLVRMGVIKIMMYTFLS